MSVFDQRAESWDANPRRRELARHVFETMSRLIVWDRSWRVLDAGAGTGLLTLAVASRVAHVTAVDTSPKMLEVLAAKAAGLPITTMLKPLEALGLPAVPFDAVVSSMALHHVTDTAAALASFGRVLRPGGHLLLADLDREDGTFHEDNTGVAHFGFDQTALAAALTEAGFMDVRFVNAWNMSKTISDGTVRPFPIFCLHSIVPES